MPDPIRLRVFDARFESGFTTKIAALLRKESRVAVQTGPMDFKKGGRCALIAFTPPGDEDVSHYDWVHVAGAGVDKIAKALRGKKRRPVLTRTIGAMGSQMAEYVLSYVLSDFQRHREREAAQEARHWDQAYGAQRFLFETKVAVLGTGGIGQAIGRALRPLAKEVTGFSREGAPKEGFGAVFRLSQMERLEDAGVLVCALPSTPETRGIVSDCVLGRLRDALFVSVGRGEAVDPAALEAALGRGHVRRAVLDVFEEEPLPETDWAWSHPEVTVTSHVSGITRPEDTAAAFLAHLEEAGGSLPTSTVDVDRGY